jgi:hypothetical protein
LPETCALRAGSSSVEKLVNPVVISPAFIQSRRGT